MAIVLAAATTSRGPAAGGPALGVAELLAAGDAALRGRVEAVRCVRGLDGCIQTEVAVSVAESFRGRFGSFVLLRVPGGRLDGEGEVRGCTPRIEPGAEYVIVGRGGGGWIEPLDGADGLRRLAPARAGRRPGGETDATLAAIRVLTSGGPIPGADMTASEGWSLLALDGMSTNPIYGASSRFLACDRGQAIPYLVDLDAMPAGITSNQALSAVSNAFAAWTAVTSLMFTNEGVASFGTGADQVTVTDRRIRVQLHDLYNRVGGGTTLGIGGRTYRYDTNTFPAGGLGGRVGANEFDESTRGHIILEHTNIALQVFSTLEEVLGHEIGHALSLAHTSEDPDEADPALREALMYYRSHGDGRGASLFTTDVAHVRQSHPSDTPPWSHPRILDAVTGAPAPPSVPGINELHLPAYDLQGGPATGVIASATAGAGDFTLVGGLLRYVPNDYYDAARVDPAGSSWYDRAYVRFLDASNASPPVLVRVISLQADTVGTSDGLPQGWMTRYFGHAAPLAVDLSRAGDDRDGDRHTNLEEFLAGTDPTNAASSLGIAAFDGSTAQWTSAPYLLYELESTTGLVGMAFGLAAPVLPTGTSASASAPAPSSGALFLRVRRVP